MLRAGGVALKVKDDRGTRLVLRQPNILILFSNIASIITIVMMVMFRYNNQGGNSHEKEPNSYRIKSRFNY